MQELSLRLGLGMSGLLIHLGFGFGINEMQFMSWDCSTNSNVHHSVMLDISLC